MCFDENLDLRAEWTPPTWLCTKNYNWPRRPLGRGAASGGPPGDPARTNNTPPSLLLAFFFCFLRDVRLFTLRNYSNRLSVAKVWLCRLLAVGHEQLALLQKVFGRKKSSGGCTELEIGGSLRGSFFFSSAAQSHWPSDSLFSRFFLWIEASQQQPST